MSSSKAAMGCVMMLALAGGALAPAAKEEAEPAEHALVCPETISVAETAAPVEGWNPRRETVKRRFVRISVFNKDNAGEYDLAPDGQKESSGKVTQTWNLKSYRTMPIFLSCHYQGASITLSREIPPSLSACTLTFHMDKGGNITGGSSMACR